jgi:hypothetical protein
MWDKSWEKIFDIVKKLNNDNGVEVKKRIKDKG